MILNSQYNVAAGNSLSVRIAGYQRRRMYEAFLATIQPGPEDTILDLGVTDDQEYDHSNYFVAWYPHKNRITAAGLDDASFLATRYPGVTFQHADGCALPFADRSFDFVHSSAVLEHVGDHARQVRFLGECWRVARRGLFLTTPNRWFPVEFHSVLPLVHWLPHAAFARILRMRGLDALAKIENLNLMSRSTLVRAARQAGVPAAIQSVALAGWTTNLLLAAKKQ